jgi:alpha-glucosidase
MNEISSFIDSPPYNGDAAVNNPPYDINNFGDRSSLNTKTLPMDALHADGTLREYDVHNLYGLTEAIATRAALESIQSVRSFVLSRSTFPGSGAHTAHWLGDNHATYDDMYRSIPGILNSNMYGITMVGSDICGFIGTTTEELCGRWTALGAFYPFARNHHEPAANQEPYLWPSVEAVAKKVLAMRYSLLPTLYTQFWRVHTQGGTVARSLMFNFPTDANTYPIDTQFMWADLLLITPVLTQGATSVRGYFPPSAVWYNLWNLSVLQASSDGWQTLPCAIEDAIVLHVAGGSILPMQTPALTTAATRLNPFSLLVALCEKGMADGALFWDSGADLEDGSNNLILTFHADLAGGSLTSTVVSNNFQGAVPDLETVNIGGFTFNPAAVSVNGSPLASSAWQWNQATQVLTIQPISASMTQPITITWSKQTATAAEDSLIAWA